jgi:hypothetical protein
MHSHSSACEAASSSSASGSPRTPSASRPSSLFPAPTSPYPCSLLANPASPRSFPLLPSPKPPPHSFQCSPLFKTLPKTSPLHGISKKRLQQRSAQPVDQQSLSCEGTHGMVLPKRVYQLQDDSFEQFKPTTGSPAALAMLQARAILNRISVI